MRIGFYFGTFNPIHVGHLNVIRAVLSSNVVDKVIIVPAIQNPWKKDVPAPFEDRVKMLQMAIAPFGDKCEVSEVERMNDVHYSYKTCQLLKEQYVNDTLFIIGGTDVGDTISKWKNYHKIIEPNFGLIIVNRFNSDSPKEVVWINDKKVVITDYALEISSTFVRELFKTYNTAYPLIPWNIENYIKQRHLYC